MLLPSASFALCIILHVCSVVSRTNHQAMMGKIHDSPKLNLANINMKKELFWEKNPSMEWGGGYEVPPLPEELLAIDSYRERNIPSSLRLWPLVKGPQSQWRTIQPRAHGHQKVKHRCLCVGKCGVDMGGIQREGWIWWKYTLQNSQRAKEKWKLKKKYQNKIQGRKEQREKLAIYILRILTK